MQTSEPIFYLCSRNSNLGPYAPIAISLPTEIFHLSRPMGTSLNCWIAFLVIDVCKLSIPFWSSLGRDVPRKYFLMIIWNEAAYVKMYPFLISINLGLIILTSDYLAKESATLSSKPQCFVSLLLGIVPVCFNDPLHCCLSALFFVCFTEHCSWSILWILHKVLCSTLKSAISLHLLIWGFPCSY